MARAVFLFLTLLLFALPYEFFFSAPRKGPLSSLKLLVVTTILLWLVRVWPARSQLLSQRASWISASGVHSLARLGALFWTSLFALALTASVEPSNSLKFAGKMAIGWLIFLVVTELVAARAQRASVLVSAFCANCVVFTLVGIGELQGWGWAEKMVSAFRDERFWLGARLRLASTLEYPNTAALLLAQGVILSVFLIARTRVRQVPTRFGLGQLFLWSAVSVIATAGLALTYSRGAWLGALAGLVLGAVLSWQVRETRRVAALLLVMFGALGLIYLSLVFFDPNFRARGFSLDSRPLFQIEYAFAGPGWSAGGGERPLLEPGREYSLEMVAHNRGVMSLSSRGRDAFSLSFLWFDAQENRIVEERGILTPLPHDLLPGDSIALRPRFRTPDREGEFVLLWDFLGEQTGWLGDRGSERHLMPLGVYPGSAKSEQQGARISRANAANYVKAYQGGNRASLLYRSRYALWRTAWRIFRENPWTGIGPGNFRLVYGKYLGLQHWDDRIHANNMYLEFLADTGLPGVAVLGMFLVALARCGWQAVVLAPDLERKVLALALLAALGGWAAHGIFDYFLEFTPTYLMFWIWAGLLGGLRASCTLPDNPPPSAPGCNG